MPSTILSEDNPTKTIYPNTFEITEESVHQVIDNTFEYSSKNWVSKASLHLLDERNNTKNRLHRRNIVIIKEQWKHLSKQAQQSYQTDEQEYSKEYSKQLEKSNSQGSSMKIRKIMNEINESEPS